ncbi:HTH domain-containing protein [Alkalicoccobacillus gibsonii]|uniref:HTH domain-containing protein n=1 Tax=Alkalicoccobacillus gibsonii TaxID=79881 RepID=UPI00351154E8
MLRIGVLTACHSEEFIKKAVNNIDTVEFIYLPYEKPSQILLLYKENEHKVDGFLLSGIYTQSVLTKELQTIELPHVYLDISEADFYQSLFNLSRNNGLDLSRMIFDFLNIENNYMGLNQILSEDERPFIFSEHFTDYFHEEVYDQLIDFHVSLWNKGLVDLSVTRMSNVVTALKSKGIRTLFLFPSEESIQRSVQTLVHQMEKEKLENNQMAVGHISGVTKETSLLCISEMKRFQYKEGYSFLLHNNNSDVEIITTQGELKNLTNQFTSCTLSHYLTDQTGETIHVGWGTGKSLLQARLHAEAASRHDQGSYVLTETELIGPLNGEPSMVNRELPIGGALNRISDQSGLTILQLQKIQAVLKRAESNVISAEELAFHLGVTIRSANRILKKLEEANLAEVLHKKQERLRGRPKKIYKISI